MTIALGVLAGFFVGVVLTFLFGNKIAAAAKADTEKLVNGVESRVRTQLAGIEAGIHTKLNKFRSVASTEVNKI